MLGIVCSKTIVTTNKSLRIYIGSTILETNVQIQMTYNEFNYYNKGIDCQTRELTVLIIACDCRQSYRI